MNTADKHKELYVKQVLKLASVDKPGATFTSSVMDKINSLDALEENKVTSSTPLISWKGWLVITIIVIALFSVLQFTTPANISFTYFNAYLEKLRSFNIDISFSISKIFVTGLFSLVFFLLVEISLIMRRLNGPDKA
jgi:hypothetical protein